MLNGHLFTTNSASQKLPESDVSGKVNNSVLRSICYFGRLFYATNG